MPDLINGIQIDSMWHTSQNNDSRMPSQYLEARFQQWKIVQQITSSHWFSQECGCECRQLTFCKSSRCRSGRSGSSCGDSSCSNHALSPSESRADPVTTISLPWWCSISPSSHLSVVICLYLGARAHVTRLRQSEQHIHDAEGLRQFPPTHQLYRLRN